MLFHWSNACRPVRRTETQTEGTIQEDSVQKAKPEIPLAASHVESLATRSHGKIWKPNQFACRLNSISNIFESFPNFWIVSAFYNFLHNFLKRWHAIWELCVQLRPQKHHVNPRCFLLHHEARKLDENISLLVQYYRNVLLRLTTQSMPVSMSR